MTVKLELKLNETILIKKVLMLWREGLGSKRNKIEVTELIRKINRALAKKEEEDQGIMIM